MATNFGVKTGKIWLFTFIRSPGIPKRIAISPFWFLKVHLWSGYIVCKFGELWYSEGRRLAPLIYKNKSFETNYLRIYLTDFHQIFTIW